MREIPSEKLVLYGVTVAVVCALTPFLGKIPRKFGRQPLVHVAYLALAVAMIFLVPEWVQDDFFAWWRSCCGNDCSHLRKHCGGLLD